MRPIVRLFQVILRFYPPEYRRSVGADALGTFAALYADAASAGTRTRVAIRGLVGALTGLPLAWWEVLLADRRGAGSRWRGVVRRLLRRPAFTLPVVALLAIGTGTTTGIVSVVDSVLFAPLPYPGADRLVYFGNGNHSVSDVGAWSTRLESFEVVAGARPGEASVSGPGRTSVRAEAIRVTEGFLSGWGAGLAAGRLPDGEDFAAQRRVAVVDHGFWQNALGADAAVVGRDLSIDGAPYELIGVLSPAFVPPETLVGGQADVWIPILDTDGVLVDPASRPLVAYGLLQSGVDLAQAQAEMDRTAADLERELPEFHRDADGTRLEVPLSWMADELTAGVRLPLLVLLGAAAVLFLATCASAAGLLLARGESRRREWGVRVAMGARPGAIAGEVLLEAGILLTAATGLGLLLARAGVGWMIGLQPGLLPRTAEIGIGVRPFVIAGLLAGLSALLLGAVAMFSARRAGAEDALRTARAGTGTGARRVQSGLVAAQVGLTTLLLLGGGLVTRSLITLTAVDLGFEPERAIYASVPLGRETVGEERIRIVRELREAIGSLPGVASVGGGMTSPLQYTGSGRCCWQVQPTVDGAEHPAIFANPVTTGYFEALGIEMLSGRTFTEDDGPGEPIPVVLNEAAAEELFGGRGAPGQTFQLRLGGPDAVSALVVGIAPDVRHWGPTESPEPLAYLPWEAYGSWASRFGMAIRTDARAPASVAAVREAAGRAVPSVALDVLPYDDLAGETVARPRFFAALIGAFALAALAIAAGGLFATLLFQVRQRRREMGIRLALGANAGRVARQVLRRGGGIVLVGTVLGATAFPFAARPLQSLAWGVPTSDPGTVVAVLALLVATTVAATWVPARLAARTDPLAVLREE